MDARELVPGFPVALVNQERIIYLSAGRGNFFCVIRSSSHVP